MRPDRDAVEKALRQHLGLFGSPSANQLEASKARVRERLQNAVTGPAAFDGAQARKAGHYASSPAEAGHYVKGVLLLGTAAAVIALVVKAPSPQTDWLATVDAADGSHYTLQPNAPLRSRDAGTMLRLKDGSRVEMRSDSELSLERAADGIGIRLRNGALVVDAIELRDGHLYVHTKDMTVAVAKTMFVVNAEDAGSRVTVIEGEVRVRDGAIEKKLKPGEQVSSSAALAARAVREEFSWSRRADAIYAAFTRGMTETSAPIVPRPTAPAAVAPQASKAATPEFEEASIRQCDPNNLPETPDGGRGGGANSFQLTPGRLRALCTTVATLIRTAYGYGPADLDFLIQGPGRGDMNFGNVYGLGVEDGRRVKGGPDWVRSERYTVNAIAGTGVQASAEMLRRQMLQRLLETRFQLKAHVEAEQVPAFALTVARGGPKMKAVAADGCEALPARPGSPLEDGRPLSVLTPPRNFADVRNGQKPSCGLWRQTNGPNLVFVGGSVPVTALTQMLGSRLGGVRVIDRTGLSDRFNFVLEFVVDENAPGLVNDLRAAVEPSDIPRAATIFTAIEEELGLKLERAQSSREFIVVDHIEHPSPN